MLCFNNYEIFLIKKAINQAIFDFNFRTDSYETILKKIDKMEEIKYAIIEKG